MSAGGRAAGAGGAEGGAGLCYESTHSAAVLHAGVPRRLESLPKLFRKKEILDELRETFRFQQSAFKTLK